MPTHTTRLAALLATALVLATFLFDTPHRVTARPLPPAAAVG